MEQMQVPYIVHEASVARMERTNKRLLIGLVIVVVLMFLTNLCWLWMWNQYDYVSSEDTVTLETRDGTANYIGNDGDIINGEDNGAAQEERP